MDYIKISCAVAFVTKDIILKQCTRSFHERFGSDSLSASHVNANDFVLDLEEFMMF